ncbi:hypothetical protein AAFF_G00407540 [Aldrovandia affinis]|uniref:Uncharacterized protein n=1 Tax=Aldrovandia affinis TaxID=143900 RepID=A0AAD7SBT4_9TELE|nr:hypothetical protein AAFF_G00407540 [Aldrovandia affinis]
MRCLLTAEFRNKPRNEVHWKSADGSIRGRDGAGPVPRASPRRQGEGADETVSIRSDLRSRIAVIDWPRPIRPETDGVTPGRFCGSRLRPKPPPPAARGWLNGHFPHLQLRHGFRARRAQGAL